MKHNYQWGHWTLRTNFTLLFKGKQRFWFHRPYSTICALNLWLIMDFQWGAAPATALQCLQYFWSWWNLGWSCSKVTTWSGNKQCVEEMNCERAKQPEILRTKRVTIPQNALQTQAPTNKGGKLWGSANRAPSVPTRISAAPSPLKASTATL